MDELTLQLTPTMLAIVPAVAAILQVAKRFKAVEVLKPWFPFISIVIALGLCYAAKMPDPIAPSIVIGLVASGSYDVLKAPSK